MLGTRCCFLQNLKDRLHELLVANVVVWSLQGQGEPLPLYLAGALSSESHCLREFRIFGFKVTFGTVQDIVPLLNTNQIIKTLVLALELQTIAPADVAPCSEAMSQI